MRHAMGVAVFAGMIGVTTFGLFLTPIFYALLRSFVTRGGRAAKPAGITTDLPATVAPANQ
jgi:hypothetical protein